MEFLKKIHITLDDYLTRIHECYDGKHNYIDYFIEPYGPMLQNELSDTVYEDEGCSICYHEHSKGTETFLVDHGTVEVTSCGKRAYATEGDIIHTATFTPHAFNWMHAGTTQREMFQETLMNEDMMANARHRVHHPDTFDMMMNGKGNESVFHQYTPVTVEVEKEQLPLIRPYNGGIAQFQFPGCLLRMKVGRWETKGLKEIWQLCMEPGFEIRCNEFNPYYSLYIVQEGSLDVRIDGMDRFVANQRDILHIPNHLAYELKAREPVVLFDFNCEGYLYRAMEEIYAVMVNEPERLNEAAEEILRRNDFHIRGCQK